MGNAYNDFARYDGTTVTPYALLPKGNILTVFEDKLFIAGNVDNPSTIFYSNINDPLTFPTINIIKLQGTDKITGTVKYYDSLIVLKENSVWKVTFVMIGTTWTPKIEALSENYGCISPKAYCWVENDIWFFTGKEVRRIGYLSGGGTGILGFDPTTMSIQIKETLKRCNTSYVNESVAYYYDKKFYLSVPYSTATSNNLTFVCHLLYDKTWTKIKSRKKANINCMVIWNNGLYQASSDVAGRNYKHSTNYNDAGNAISASVMFKKNNNKDFITTSIFRYITVELKNVLGICKISLIFDCDDERTIKTKTFYIGTSVDTMEDTIGETLIGEMLISDGYGEEVEITEYLKRKISFLGKGQSFKVGFSNETLDGYFTLSKFGLGFKERTKNYIHSNNLIFIK